MIAMSRRPATADAPKRTTEAVRQPTRIGSEARKASTSSATCPDSYPSTSGS
jgi:hypothetical protein